MKQEEKAKAYDSIIEKANKMHSENCEACKACIEELIPELAESNDEKIREELLSFCQNRADNYPNDPKYANISNWIAWLEKQGQVKESTISQHENKMCKENNDSLTSEDEKVRKALVKLLECENFNGYVTLDGIDIEDVLGWLERQGEHANFLNKIQVGDKVTRNENGVLVNLSQLKRVAKPSEKQGEQKASYTTIVETGDSGINALVTLPIEMKTAEESLGISSDEYNKIVDECLFGEQKLTEFERGLFDMLTDISKPCTADCVKSHSEKLLSIARKMIALEQKPKENKGNIVGISSNWSEEDDKVRTTIINEFEQCSEWCCTNGLTKEDCIDWLQLLKGRVQPKQEWSEEDEAKRNALIGLVEEIKNQPLRRLEDWDGYISWLKSLRPQNRWKPSDEQIGLLQAIINEPKNAASESCQIVLREVLEQLKKLKEE